MLKIVVGTSVEGENFYGREEELAALERMVETDHILLLAPRRVGKSSLLRALLPGPTTDGRTPVFADVQDVRSEGDFVGRVFAAIQEAPAGRPLRPGRLARWRQGKAKLKSVHGPGGIGVELEAVDHGWQAEADRAFERLLALDHRWLILVDELPNLIVALADADATGGRVREFLGWFRRLRQRRDARDKLRFVLCGSIGLDTVARRYRISDTINDLRSWSLGPFDPVTADHFLDALAVSYAWTLTPAVRARILHEVEWLIPHHLQGVMSELNHLPHRGMIGEQHVEVAIATLISRRNYFNSWDERLTLSLGAPRDQHARTILRICALDPRGALRPSLQGSLSEAITDPAVREATLADLIEMLASDGYLVEHVERLRFRSSLLRRYWLRHFT